ncbi:transcriptional regulator, partial [Escherichia coli]
LAILDGVLINYIAICLASARKKQGKDALVVGWNIQDTTRLWLEGWIASQQGWRIDVLAHSLNQLRPELFEGRTLLVWCGENRTSAQQQQLTSWQEQGHDIFPLGI